MFRGNRIWKKLNIFWWKTRSLIGVLYVQFNFQAWNKLSVSDFKIKIYKEPSYVGTIPWRGHFLECVESLRELHLRHMVRV